MRGRFLLASLTGMALLAAACGGSRPTHHYTLELLSGSTASASPVPADLLIGRITAPAILRDDRIVYRTGSSQLDVYDYHRWAEMPAPMLESLLLRQFRARGRFRSVQPMRSNTRGDFVVRGHLYDLSEVSGGALSARVVMELELAEHPSGRAVLARYYEKSEPVTGKEVKDVVEALNRAVQASLSDFASAVEAHFAAHPPR
jgi:ABC-type uncharacterized transport system auxiliary subunit